MKFVERLKFTAIGTSAATITLSATVPGFQTLAQAIANGALVVGDTGVPFTIDDGAGNKETSFFTISSTTVLTRTSVDTSSAGGTTAATFTGASLTVFSSMPASFASKLITVASLAGSYAVGQVLTAAYPAGTIGTIQFTRTMAASPFTKTAISGAVASAVNSLSYTVQSADAGYKVGVDCSNQVSTVVGGLVAGVASTSAILYAEKIPTLLSAMKSSGTQRSNIAWHGMSIDFGAGSIGPTSDDWADSMSALGMVPKMSAALNTARGGTFGRGIEVIADYAGINKFYTLGGGATMLAEQATTAGAASQAVSLAAAATSTLSFTVVNGVAGQVIRVYAITTQSVPVTGRYSTSGANTLAATNLPASTSNPQTGLTAWWYETNITLPLAGNTVVTLLAPTGGTGSFVVYAVDPDYKTVPGLTVHRAVKSGGTMGNVIAAFLDDTDTKPAGNWVSAAAKTAWRAAQTASMVDRLGAQGVIASFDVNDIATYNTLGYTLADHTRHLTNYVNAMAAKNLQVLFVCGSLRSPDTPSIAGTPYTQSDIIEAYRSVAAASTNAAFLDLTLPFRGATEALTFAAQTADTSRWLAAEAPRYIHPSAAGHAYYGKYVSDQIIAAW